MLNISGSRADDGNNSSCSISFYNNRDRNRSDPELSGSGTAAQSTPGVGITVNTTSPGLTLTDGSGSASNYTLTGGTHTVDITATSAYITGTKVYDSFATVNSSVLSLVDPSNPGASVTISGSGTASSANAANGIQITSR